MVTRSVIAVPVDVAASHLCANSDLLPSTAARAHKSALRGLIPNASAIICAKNRKSVFFKRNSDELRSTAPMKMRVTSFLRNEPGQVYQNTEATIAAQSIFGRSEPNLGNLRTLLAAISLLCLTAFIAPAQRGGGPAGQLREVTVTEIPGVIAAGAPWKVVWQGTDNADGIVGTADGGLLFAQEQPGRISKLGSDNKLSILLEDTHGTGALTVDSKGRIFGVERTCTDPGKDPANCKEPTAVAELSPDRRILADNIDGKTLGRLNDLIADKKGGFYFNGAALFYLNATGKVATIGENIRTNGITLSPDEKTLYVTNGGEIVAFDVQPDGAVRNQRVLGKLEAGIAGGAGDGMTIDAAGRIYVTTGRGVQVLSPEGTYLGLIPTPRTVISVAFSGPDKKTLYVVGSGALGADGKEIATPRGIRNNAKSIYTISMIAAGFAGRVK